MARSETHARARGAGRDHSLRPELPSEPAPSAFPPHPHRPAGAVHLRSATAEAVIPIPPHTGGHHGYCARLLTGRAETPVPLPGTVLWADFGLNAWEIENKIGLGVEIGAKSSTTRRPPRLIARFTAG